MKPAKTMTDIVEEMAMLTQRIGELCQQVNERDAIISLAQSVCGRIVTQHDHGIMPISGGLGAIDTLRSLLADIDHLMKKSKENEDLRAVIAIAKRAIAVDETPGEKWPKWYMLDEEQAESFRPWAIERYSETQCRRHGFNQHDEPTVEENCWNYKAEMWIEVTEAEALARITPQTQAKHTPEFCTKCGVHSVVDGTKTCGGCAEVCELVSEWEPVIDSAYVLQDEDELTHHMNYGGGLVSCKKLGRTGETVADVIEWANVRRRKVVHIQTVERIPVKLYWYDGNIVGRYAHTPPMDESFLEIFSDGNGGWYVDAS